VTQKPYDEKRIAAAVQQFEAAGLTPVEALLAANQLLQSALTNFRADAPRFRQEIGEERTREFARHELNDIIYELQDAVAPTLRIYNSLFRDPDQKHDSIPGE
jgi:hypothetical protein